MKIKSRKREGNTVELTIEVEKETQKKAEDKSWQQASGEIKVPGFRAGKAPRAVLEQYINIEYLKEQVIRNIISEIYPQVIKETGIEPVDYPKIDPKPGSDGQPLVLEIKVEVLPEIKLGNYKGLKVKQKKSEVEESEVESFIDNLRQRHALFHPAVDRTVKTGDLVALNSKATLEGKEFPMFSREGLTVLLGAGQIHETFDEQIIGLSIENNKKFKVAFPKEYKTSEIADKEIEFDITIKNISEKKLPNLDDDFAKKLGSTDIEALRSEIRGALTTRNQTESEEVLKNDLIDQIEQKTKVDIPSVLIERELDTMVSEAKRSLEPQGINLDNYLKNINKSMPDFRADMRERAIKRVKNKLVLEEIAKQETLTVSDIDLEVELRALSRESGQDPAQMQKSIGEGVIEYIKDYLLRRKALDFVVANAKIEEER